MAGTKTKSTFKENKDMIQNYILQKFPDVVDLYTSLMSRSERKIVEPYYTSPARQCIRCNQVKPISDFFEECFWCKNCASEVKARQREYQRKYQQRPGVKTRQKEYGYRPDVNARQKEYQRKYQQRPGVKTRQKEYRQRPGVKERLEEYRQRPENIARQREYQRKYQQRPGVKARQKGI
jgi:hypothetical protein